MVFFLGNRPQSFASYRSFNYKIWQRIFDHTFNVAETKEYVEIKPLFSLCYLQLWDFIKTHVVKSVAVYKLS